MIMIMIMMMTTYLRLTGTFAVVCLMNGEVIQGMTSKFTPKTVVPPLNSSINGTGSSAASVLLQTEIDAYRVQVAVSLCCIVGLIQVWIIKFSYSFI